MNGGEDERELGSKGRKKDITRVLMYTKTCFLFLQVVIRRALTHSTHMKHFEESDSGSQ